MPYISNNFCYNIKNNLIKLNTTDEEKYIPVLSREEFLFEYIYLLKKYETFEDIPNIYKFSYDKIKLKDLVK